MANIRIDNVDIRIDKVEFPDNVKEVKDPSGDNYFLISDKGGDPAKVSMDTLNKKIDDKLVGFFNDQSDEIDGNKTKTWLIGEDGYNESIFINIPSGSKSPLFISLFATNPIDISIEWADQVKKVNVNDWKGNKYDMFIEFNNSAEVVLSVINKNQKPLEVNTTLRFEKIGYYSTIVDSLDTLKDGEKVISDNLSVLEETRALKYLEGNSISVTRRDEKIYGKVGKDGLDIAIKSQFDENAENVGVTDVGNLGALGDSSISIGTLNQSKGMLSLVLGGMGNKADGVFGMTIGGMRSNASGQTSVNIGGTDNTNSGRRSIVIGSGNNSAEDSIIIGSTSENNSRNSILIGGASFGGSGNGFGNIILGSGQFSSENATITGNTFLGGSIGNSVVGQHLSFSGNLFYNSSSIYYNSDTPLNVNSNIMFDGVSYGSNNIVFKGSTNGNKSIAIGGASGGEENIRISYIGEGGDPFTQNGVSTTSKSAVFNSRGARFSDSTDITAIGGINNESKGASDKVVIIGGQANEAIGAKSSFILGGKISKVSGNFSGVINSDFSENRGLHTTIIDSKSSLIEDKIFNSSILASTDSKLKAVPDTIGGKNCAIIASEHAELNVGTKGNNYKWNNAIIASYYSKINAGMSYNLTTGQGTIGTASGQLVCGLYNEDEVHLGVTNPKKKAFIVGGGGNTGLTPEDFDRKTVFYVQHNGDMVNTGNITTTQYKLSKLNTPPASATAVGVEGEIRVTPTHIYVCTATNTWLRTALETW